MFIRTQPLFHSRNDSIVMFPLIFMINTVHIYYFHIVIYLPLRNWTKWKWRVSSNLIHCFLLSLFCAFILLEHLSFQVALVLRNLPANTGDQGDMGSTPGLGRSPEGGNVNTLQYSRLENPMDRRAWQATQPIGSQRAGHDWASPQRDPRERTPQRNVGSVYIGDIRWRPALSIEHHLRGRPALDTACCLRVRVALDVQ